MIRALLLVALLCAACRWLTGRWPWDYLKPARTRAQDLAAARRLLGVSATASRGQIAEAHRRLVMVAHPDKGGTPAQMHEANAARDLLLDAISEEAPPP